MFKSAGCHQTGKIFENALWQNVFTQSPQVLFVRMNYTDHLGNIRLSYTTDPFVLGAKILEETEERGSRTQKKRRSHKTSNSEQNNYYPFGLKHGLYNTPARDFRPIEDNREIEMVSDNPYNYMYQGQERQNELGLNWDSFKWRNYDYALGRFMSIDPLAEEYSYQSPYNFAENRVVDGNELEGLEWVDANGNKIYDPNLQNEDGSRGGYTQFASQQDIDYGNGLRNSGETGASMFSQLVNSELPISVEFNNEDISGFSGYVNTVLDNNNQLTGFSIIIWTKQVMR